jgi:predicted transcriptional regulator
MEENVRTAYILKYAADMPEDSRRPDELRTIAKVLGVSGRTVRNYLRRAEQEIEEWRAGGSAKGGADR